MGVSWWLIRPLKWRWWLIIPDHKAHYVLGGKVGGPLRFPWQSSLVLIWFFLVEKTMAKLRRLGKKERPFILEFACSMLGKSKNYSPKLWFTMVHSNRQNKNPSLRLHPQRLTWNLKMMVSKRNLLFQLIFRFHVHLQGCKCFFSTFLLMVSKPVTCVRKEVADVWFSPPKQVVVGLSRCFSLSSRKNIMIDSYYSAVYIQYNTYPIKDSYCYKTTTSVYHCTVSQFRRAIGVIYP